MIPDFPALTDHIYIWIFGIILPFLSGLQSHQLSGSIKFDSQLRRKLYLSNSLMLSLAGGSVLLMWLFKKRSLTSLGFSLPDWDKYVLITLLLFVFISLYLADLFISSRKQENLSNEAEWYEKSSFLPEKWKEIPAFMLLCLCAGIFEEIIYRGFMVNYFIQEKPGELFPIPALLAPAILFSLAHFYQGWTSVFKIFLFTLLLNFIFIQTKSIYPTMIIHFLVDLISGMSALFSKSNRQ
jgi:membrane protease YdiL (CAAX protease family)